MPAHEKDHVGHHDHGDGPDDGLEAFLLSLRQFRRDDLQGDADGNADGDGYRHSDPYLAKRVPPPLLAQEGRNDADDEGSL